MSAVPPDDQGSRRITIPDSVSPRPLVAMCVKDPAGGRRGYLCRIGYADRQGEGPVDIYYPYADVGMLWFRDEGGVGCVSGMLKRALFPTAERAEAFLSYLEQELGTSAQGVCIELVDAAHCVILNGEESLFLAGDGEDGARFSPIPDDSRP